jgi:transposase
MRGSDTVRGALFSYVDLEKRVRPGHPLRVIGEITNDALASLPAEFDRPYAPNGRESIPPERLLRAFLLQAFYSIRSERQLVERIEFDLLFRWFVGLGVDDPGWDATTFTKNRDRLLAGEVAVKFLAAVVAHARVKRLLSNEHFSVDGTLIEAWSSPKSFQPKDGSGSPPGPGRNGERDFMASVVAMTHTSPRPTPTPGSTARAAARRPNCPSWARANREPQWADRRRARHPRLGSCRASGGPAFDGAPCRPGRPGHARLRQGL